MTDWHQLDVAAAVARLDTAVGTGLSPADAARRLEAHGPNALPSGGVRSPSAIVREQLTATMVVILIVAAAISAVVGDVTDALVIAVIVVLNASLGFAQEYRAERAMAALQRLAVPSVRVRRGGEVHDVPAATLVPGDVMLLEAGNLVAADGRLVDSASLAVQESTLTGEAEAVHKNTDSIAAGASSLGDRRNMVYMGTVVAHGRGVAVVTATGMHTELGRIAALLQKVAMEPTPLQQRLDRLGRSLASAALGVVAVIFAIGIGRGEPIRTMFLTAVSMAVAAVPEGLPAAVTIALALGAQRMLRRQALVRKLSAVEALGSVTVICSDKTGTLTENTMRVAEIVLYDRHVDLASQGALAAWIDPSSDGPVSTARTDAPLAVLLAGFALCNDVAAGRSKTVGDPTEVALVEGASRFGLTKPDLERLFPRVLEAPFDADRKRMTTVHAVARGAAPVREALRHAHGAAGLDDMTVAFTKGAVDRLLDVSSAVWTSDGVAPLAAPALAHLRAAADRLAARGMRVLGLAVRFLPRVPPDPDPDRLEDDLVFVGMAGLIDPPRSEARAAVETCRAAGVRAVMITGDHPLTAAYIAREVGIGDGGTVVTGIELDRLSDGALQDVVQHAHVYARVSPEHKLRIVSALQAGGEIVAMTGDGVNDAPALRKASIGVAMGVTGTDVSKQAADMVLLDDNFATIVAAVAEGRVIYDNIRKFVKYLLTTNSAELIVMLIAPLLGMPLPLLPLQILWVNLVTDGPAALALAVEPAEPGIMRRRPIRPDASLLAGDLVTHVVLIGAVMSAVSIAAGYWYWRDGHREWQTVVFTVVALAQMGHVLAIRSDTIPLWRRGAPANWPLFAAVATTVVLQAAIVYLPAAHALFGTVALPPADVVVSLAVALVVPAAVEVEKWRRRR